MYTCFQANFGMTGGSAIFGSLLPARSPSKSFISNFAFASQDSVQQERAAMVSVFPRSAGITVPPQFIGTF